MSITKKQGTLLEMNDILKGLGIKYNLPIEERIIPEDKLFTYYEKYDNDIENLNEIKERAKNDFLFFLLNFINPTKHRYYEWDNNYCYQNYDIDIKEIQRPIFNLDDMITMKLLTSGQSMYMMSPRCREYSNKMISYYILWDMLRTNCTKTYTIISNICSIGHNVKELNSELPDYLRLNDRDISRSIRCINKIKNRQYATLLGRGLTSNAVIFENIEHKSFADIVFKNMLPTHEVMVKNGIDRQIIVTTSMGIDGTFEREFGDKMAMTLPKWMNDLFNCDLVNREKEIFYIKSDYTKIFDDPEDVYCKIAAKYNANYDVINRELLFNR